MNEAGSEFHTTHWSKIAAASENPSSAANAALAELCQTYWYPLYAYVRRRIGDRDEAQDLTQEFFTRLLDRRWFATASAERGRFRAFLLTALKHFLANEWHKGRAQKRRAADPVLRLDFADGESRLQAEPGHDETPERLFDRAWAQRILHATVDELARSYTEAGKSVEFEALLPLLTDQGARGAYPRAARHLGRSEAALRMAAHRMRTRFRELLRQQIARTVTGPEQIDEEIHALFAALEAP
jgi:RNA polymerase sigma-70 factor (ECF subfamily)